MEVTRQWICLNTFRDLPYDALTLLENVLDSSHVSLPITVLLVTGQMPVQ